MAQRFGGRYSPDPNAPQAGNAERPPVAPLSEARLDAVDWRANLMFLPPVILAFTSFGSGPVGLAAGLVGAGSLGLGAWLLREGLRAQSAYEARPIARRPALPRKILAAALSGIGVALAGWSGGTEFLGPVVYGVVAAALHLAAFGIDPMRDKHIDGVDRFQQERVARVVDEAETYLSQIKEAVTALGDRRLDQRVAGFLGRARQMIRSVEQDPRDLTAARKYLGVYLMGARDASVKFAEHYRRSRDDSARTDYEALLTDLEGSFAARTEAMIGNDRSDMDLEIKVLRERLGREGIRVDP